MNGRTTLEQDYLERIYKLKYPKVDITPFRKYAERTVLSGEMTWAGLAVHAGITRADGTGDTTHLKRILGVVDWTDSHAHALAYGKAVKLCVGWGLTPAEVGL